MIKFLKISEKSLKYFKNTGWVLFEQVIRFIYSFFIGAYVARYLGPEEFGALAFGLAIVSILQVLSRLGMDAIIVREINNHPEYREKIIGTSFWLMLVASIASYCLIGLFAMVLAQNSQNYIVTLILGLSILVQPFNIIDYDFKARIRSKIISIIQAIALILSGIIKMVLISLNADLIVISISYVIDAVLLVFGLLIVQKRQENKFHFRLYSSEISRKLFRSIWPMTIAGLVGILFLRLDKILIAIFLDTKSLGLYTASFRLYEGWMVIPYAVAMSVYPALVHLKKENNDVFLKSLGLLFFSLNIMTIVMIIITFFFAKDIVYTLFGEEYSKTIEFLPVIMMATLFATMGTVNSRYFSIEHMEKKTAFRLGLALITSVIFNLCLLRHIGIVAAAVSLVFSNVISNYIIDYFDKDLSFFRKIRNRSLLGLRIFK